MWIMFNMQLIYWKAKQEKQTIHLLTFVLVLEKISVSGSHGNTCSNPPIMYHNGTFFFFPFPLSLGVGPNSMEGYKKKWQKWDYLYRITYLQADLDACMIAFNLQAFIA